MKNILIITMVFIFVVVVSQTIWAHKPVNVNYPATREDPIIVNDHQISWAAYTELSTINEVDYYRLEVNEGEEIYANLLIPKIERLKDYDPTIALIGPGLPKDYEVNNIQLQVKDDEGVIVKRYGSDSLEEFYEPFTMTRYYVKQTLITKAPVTGSYHLTVFNEDNQKGKYVFAIGRKEVWRPAEIAKLPKTWWDVRIFMEKEKSTYAITLGIGVLGLYLLSTLF